MGGSTTRDSKEVDDGKRAGRQRTGIDGCVLAGRQLPVGRSDLSLRQPAAQANPNKGTHQAAAPRPLGNNPGVELHLCPPNPLNKKDRLKHDFISGPGDCGAGPVANAYLEGTYSEVYPNIS